MAEKYAHKAKISRMWHFGLTAEQFVKAREKGIKPEHLRQFVETFKTEVSNTIDSSDWKRLRSVIERTPSLQLTGDVGSGKTFLVTELIKNDKNHVYIVLDAHNEFDFLPEITTITPDLKESHRIQLPKQPQGAIGMFNVYYNLIMNQQFPRHYVVVIEEALRYKNNGILNLLAESRKFLFVLAVTQELLTDFCPRIKVEPYNEFRL